MLRWIRENKTVNSNPGKKKMMVGLGNSSKEGNTGWAGSRFGKWNVI